MFKKIIPLVFLFSISFFSKAQDSKNIYKDSKERTHLCGNTKIEWLEENPEFNSWFLENYNSFTLKKDKRQKWAKKLKNKKVEIFYGTWCGDSKYFVPQFIKLWDDLGLKRKNLKLTALYYLPEKYKTSPNGEEKGKQIHRVPTFIVYDKEGEIGRIVESPVNDLETDLAHIAMGYPSLPNYSSANFAMHLFENYDLKYLKDNKQSICKALKGAAKKPKELNTVALILKKNGQLEKAELLYKMNIEIFCYHPKVYENYADFLLEKNRLKEAETQYSKSLKIEPKNEYITSQLNIIHKGKERL
jgi:thiol-disulfide isomerase/thioredoxin